jgi:hypothetical protein
MPRPVGPSGNAPSRPSFVSGTADTMDQQIKKKKQEVYQQTLANLAKLQQDEGGGGFGFGDALKMAGGFVLSPLATATDIAAKPFELIPGVPDFQPENAGSFNLFVEGYRGIDAGLRRAGGDIAAIPGFGAPSASPTASDIRNYGVLEGVARAGIDYGNLAAAAYPAVRAGATSAGLVAPKPVPYKPMTTKQIPETAPTTPYRTTRSALAEDMAVSKSQPFPIGDDVVQQVNPSIAQGSFVVRNSELNTKQQVTYSVMGDGDNAMVIVDAEPLRQVALAGEPAIKAVIEHLNTKYPNVRIATNDPALQQALNIQAANPVLRSPTEPVRKALTFKPVQPTANESADAFSRRLAQGDQTFDRVTFSEPYEPRGTSVFVHRTLPDQAERLLKQGMEPEPRSWLGNMGSRTAGEGVFPEGTLFASQMGSPTDELFAQAMNDQFGDIRGGVPLQVTLPKNARVLEIDVDLPDISSQDFTEAGLSAKQYYDFMDILESLGGNRKNETAVKGALAQIAQRNGFDAVVMGEELMVIPRSRNVGFMTALTEEDVLSIEQLAKQRMERETKKALEEGVTSTRRAADYEKMFEGQMGTARPDTNWASVDLMNERDINNWLVDPMDVAILPESLQLKAQAQQAFRAELLPFLKRQGLTEEFIAGFPFTNRWGNPEQIARIELLESLFRRLPQTKQLYIDTMRAYGIGSIE